MAEYDSEYYKNNNQAEDRPALNFYYRFFKNQIGGISGKKKILEYGCGVGNLTKRLSQDFDCFALDISDYALKQVDKKAPKAKTIKNLTKIKNNSLDAVIALHVMEHIKTPAKVFDEFYLKLKPGGLLIFVVPNPDGLGHKMKKDKWFGFSDETHISLFEKNRWVEIVVKCGFEISKVCGDGMWDVPYLPMVPTFIQKLIFFPPAALQYFSGRVFLPTMLGECLIVVAKKK
jgi:2-polyprenyl-3-methyl-5-hydroxy-6-metoxy-1,4-benzoquinol methylase